MWAKTNPAPLRNSYPGTLLLMPDIPSCSKIQVPAATALGVEEPQRPPCLVPEVSNAHKWKPKASCSASQMSTAKHKIHTNTEHTGWGNYRIISKIFAPLTLLSREPFSKAEVHWVLLQQSAAFWAQEPLAKMASFRYLIAEAIKRELNWHF